MSEQLFQEFNELTTHDTDDDVVVDINLLKTFQLLSEEGLLNANTFNADGKYDKDTKPGTGKLAEPARKLFAEQNRWFIEAFVLLDGNEALQSKFQGGMSIPNVLKLARSLKKYGRFKEIESVFKNVRGIKEPEKISLVAQKGKIS